jgi:hypothetical protein
MPNVNLNQDGEFDADVAVVTTTVSPPNKPKLEMDRNNPVYRVFMVISREISIVMIGAVLWFGMFLTMIVFFWSMVFVSSLLAMIPIIEFILAVILFISVILLFSWLSRGGFRVLRRMWDNWPGIESPQKQKIDPKPRPTSNLLRVLLFVLKGGVASYLIVVILPRVSIGLIATVVYTVEETRILSPDWYGVVAVPLIIGAPLLLCWIVLRIVWLVRTL